MTGHAGLCRFQTQNSGAALLIGLVLLLVVSLAAITTIKIDGIDLLSANREQLSLRASYAAEAGAQSSMRSAELPVRQAVQLTGTLSPGSTKDMYKVELTQVREDGKEFVPAQTSFGRFDVFYYQVQSTGTADTRMRTTIVAEFYELQHKDNTIEYERAACASTKLLDAPSVAC